MAIRIRPVPDAPVDDARMLGHAEVVKNLRAYLEGGDMVAPFCIAVHGEWGSGKTSVMRTLAERADPEKLDVLFFEAWKYEYSSPALGLVSEIASKYHGGVLGRRRIGKAIRAAGYVLSARAGIDPEKLMAALSDPKPASERLSRALEGAVRKAKGKKLVVIIDDLDRCDPDNALQILALTKLFLSIKGCICVAAVDLERLKDAWLSRYGRGSGGGAAGWYLEKMFQARIALPKPGHDHMKEYVKSVSGWTDDDVIGLFSLLVRDNPRSVKRALNLASYRARLLSGGSGKYAAVLWTALEEATSNEFVARVHNALLSGGSSLGAAIADAGGSGPAAQHIKSTLDAVFGGGSAGMYDEKIAPFLSYGGSIASRIGATAGDLDDGFFALYRATNEAVRRPVAMPAP